MHDADLGSDLGPAGASGASAEPSGSVPGLSVPSDPGGQGSGASAAATKASKANRLSSLGSRAPATIDAAALVADVAKIMHEQNVGSVVVTKGGRPAGIVTDRDLVLRVLVPDKPAARTAVGDVMSSPLVTVADHATAIEAATRMRERKVRRLPILAADGGLVGLVTFDDLVHHLGRTGEQLSEVVTTFPIAHYGG
jgi:CBS domain-containing protein